MRLVGTVRAPLCSIHIHMYLSGSHLFCAASHEARILKPDLSLTWGS